MEPRGAQSASQPSSRGVVNAAVVCKLLAGALALAAAVLLLVGGGALDAAVPRALVSGGRLALGGAGGGGGGGGRAARAAAAAAAAAAASVATASSLSAAAGRACRVPPGRSLAIFNPRAYHSEVFGVLYAYARACNHSLAVYFDAARDALSTANYYDALYGPVSLRGTGDFARAEGAGEHDAVFLTTPEVLSFRGEAGHKENAHRYVYFIHLDRGGYKKEYQLLKMGMSPLVVYPFALPVYPPPAAVGAPGPPPGAPGLPASNARPLSAKTLVMVGTLWDGDNYLLADLFEIAEGIKAAGWALHVYSREWKVRDGVKYPSNMRLLESRPTADIIAAVQAATVMLIFPSPTSWYVTDRMTGGLPLAVSQGAPILTTEGFAAIYDLDAASGALVAARGHAQEAVDALLGLTDESYARLLDGIAGYRARAWRHAVGTIEGLLLAVPDVAAAAAAAAAGGDARPPGAAAANAAAAGRPPPALRGPMIMPPGGGGTSRWKPHER